MVTRCFCVVFVLFLSVFSGLSYVLRDKCSTPDKKPGTCIRLEDCPSLNSMSNDFDTAMTIERFNFLANSQCTFKNHILTVCCSLEELARVHENHTETCS